MDPNTPFYGLGACYNTIIRTTSVLRHACHLLRMIRTVSRWRESTIPLHCDIYPWWTNECCSDFKDSTPVNFTKPYARPTVIHPKPDHLSRFTQYFHCIFQLIFCILSAFFVISTSSVNHTTLCAQILDWTSGDRLWTPHIPLFQRWLNSWENLACVVNLEIKGLHNLCCEQLEKLND